MELSTNRPDYRNVDTYRVLAQMTHQAYKQADDACAALFARILECVWVKGMNEFRRASPAMWKRIDSSMEDFIKPILQYARGKTCRPDAATEASAYKSYRDALTLIERLQYYR